MDEQGEEDEEGGGLKANICQTLLILIHTIQAMGVVVHIFSYKVKGVSSFRMQQGHDIITHSKISPLDLYLLKLKKFTSFSSTKQYLPHDQKPKKEEHGFKHLLKDIDP